MGKMPTGFTTIRDAVSFLLGAGILVYSIMLTPPPPETLSVGVGLALIGLPATSLMGGKNGRGKSPE